MNYSMVVVYSSDKLNYNNYEIYVPKKGIICHKRE